jgi:DNA-binding beta-propeller fold protein YncE
MKTLFASSLALLSMIAVAGAEETAWNLAEGVASPESAYVDPGTGLLFVSQIGQGGATGKDGDGWISKLDVDGRVIENKWVTGLNSPKGMRSHDGVLWVSDIDRVVAVDIDAGKIVQKVDVPGATFLNDVACGPDGTVYVSDMLNSRIVQINNGKPSVLAEGPELQNPNGLLVDRGRLVIAAWGTEIADDFSTKTPGQLLALDLSSKQITAITPEPLGNLDGLEPDGRGGYVVSDWIAGKIIHVPKAGQPKAILTLEKGAADIAYLPGKKRLFVPRMVENRVTAYQF